MDYLKKLTILFSEYPLSIIEANNGKLLKDTLGVEHYKEIFALPEYKNNYSLVVEYKENIENIIKSSDHNDQIYECLFLIKKAKEAIVNEKRIYILSRLIRNTLYEKIWNDQERALYDRKYKIIVDWKDYFISYTNRDAAIINNVFEKLIKAIYMKLPHISERMKKNFVARIIAKYLQDNNNLKGFYDVDEIKCGDEIEHSILSNCQGCFVFVQLVEDKSFTIPKLGKENWCFKEYENFKQHNLFSGIMDEKHSKKFYFIITAEDANKLKPASLPPEYKTWFEHISALSFISLDKYKQFRKHIDGKELRQEMYTLASEILKTRESILEDVLNI